MRLKELVVATKNKKKLKEIRHLLQGYGFRITSLADYSRLPRIVEDGETFKENAIKKAFTIARYLKKLTLGEDSGLEVQALDNRPGVYSARYAGKNASDDKNNKKLLKQMRAVPRSKRKARYVCSVALADSDGVIATVEAYCLGMIACKERGSHGFGYDPLFLIPRFGKTFGELGETIKHSMSHRSKALRKAKRFIVSRQK